MSGLVSVIVPAYNYARFLPDCIASLSRQSYAKWECIIVDDGSTDDTPEICARLATADGRVRSLRQSNRGLSAARNAGIWSSAGEVFQFLDADDVLEPDKLRTQMNVLAQRPDVDIIVGPAAFFVDDVPGRLRPWRPFLSFEAPPAAAAEISLPAVVAANICVVHAALVRRRVIETVGFFDTTLAAHEDWDFWLRCALSGKRFLRHDGVADRALVREHRSSMSSSRDKMILTAILVRERLAKRLPPELRAFNAERLSETEWRYGIDLMKAGRVGEGWTFYRAGLNRSSRKAYVVSRLLTILPGVSLMARLARRPGAPRAYVDRTDA